MGQILLCFGFVHNSIQKNQKFKRYIIFIITKLLLFY
jgi:hypothetical protein